MKLYYAAGACSLAPHIALSEAGIAAKTVPVDLKTHKLPDGSDYTAVNPKGYVPMLELDDGTKLTEVAVLLQVIADKKPGTLAPAAGTMERYKLMEWLNFIATEIHKGFSPLWAPDTPELTKQRAIAAIKRRLGTVDAQLAKTPYLAGGAFTIADAYLFTIVNWTNFIGLDVSAFKHLAASMKRVAERPAVHAAMKAEGLVK
jgi:glutathione S-transferase